MFLAEPLVRMLYIRQLAITVVTVVVVVVTVEAPLSEQANYGTS